MATSEHDIRHMMGEINRAFNSHQMDQLLSMYTDDAILENEAENRAYCGKDEIRKFLREQFDAFGDLVFRMDNQLICGDTVVTENLMSGTHTGPARNIPATGRHVQFRRVNVYELENGKVRRHRMYYEQLTIADQLGVTQQMRPQPWLQPSQMGPNPTMGM